jgi:kinetochore protein NDC80
MAAVPGLNQPTKDPRPVREKPFQAQISRVISNFLASTGSPIQLSPKIYASPPTSQQYWTVVDWLIRQLDPEYPEPRQGGFAIGPNEYIGLLRWLRYPFVDAIDKKSLSTVGGLHSWPAMLAALHYLVSLAIVSFPHK